MKTKKKKKWLIPKAEEEKVLDRSLIGTYCGKADGAEQMSGPCCACQAPPHSLS